MNDLETIGELLRKAGATFSIHAEPLTSLSFCNKPLPSGMLEDIAQMTCVKELYLGGSNVTDSDIVKLSKLQLLTWLELSDTQITNQAIQSANAFPRLETLMLYGTAIDDECIPFLTLIRTLKEVGLDDTAISNEGLKELKQGNPKLQIA